MNKNVVNLRFSITIYGHLKPQTLELVTKLKNNNAFSCHEL